MHMTPKTTEYRTGGSPPAIGIYYVLKRLFRASNRRAARARVAGHNECASIWRPNSRSQDKRCGTLSPNSRMAVSQKLLTGGRDATCRGSPIFYWGEAEAKRLHRASPKTGERRSLRKIAAELAMLGHLTSMAAALQRQVGQEHDRRAQPEGRDRRRWNARWTSRRFSPSQRALQC
jgi:hypothetical protein